MSNAFSQTAPCILLPTSGGSVCAGVVQIGSYSDANQREMLIGGVQLDIAHPVAGRVNLNLTSMHARLWAAAFLAYADKIDRIEEREREERP